MYVQWPTPSSIPVFILAGGIGTRLSEATMLMPKSLVEIGDVPTLTHIMRYSYSFGFNDFVICAGYRSYAIKKYFLNYQYIKQNIKIDTREDHGLRPKPFGTERAQEKWRVRILDTGLNAMGGHASWLRP